MNEYLAALAELPPTLHSWSWHTGYPRSNWDTLDIPDWDKAPRVDYRRDMVERFAWAIPSDKAITAIAKLSPIVEIGAGRGYWAYLLRKAGADVVAYDLYPHGHPEWWRPNGDGGAWTEILRGGAIAASRHPDRTLLLVWPPMTPMAADALRAYRGSTVAYVGEGRSGCTGDDAFHRALDREWQEVRTVSLPNWDGIHDDLTIYRRKP
jgi:hypothetical protein